MIESIEHIYNDDFEILQTYDCNGYYGMEQYQPIIFLTFLRW